jgi:hypothetical protein
MVGALSQSVHSRLALCKLLKLRRCAEGWLAREWTYWKPRNKTRERTFSDRHPTIPRAVCNIASGRNAVVRNGVPFLTSAGQAPLVHDDALCEEERGNLRPVPARAG